MAAAFEVRVLPAMQERLLEPGDSALGMPPAVPAEFCRCLANARLSQAGEFRYCRD